jgi:hypothetical protein
MGSNQGNTPVFHAARNPLNYNAECLQKALRSVTLRSGKLNHAEQKPPVNFCDADLSIVIAHALGGTAMIHDTL